jgi:hypothetical protein
MVLPPLSEMLVILEYPPPPPPEPEKAKSAVCPPPPAPIVSTLLPAEFQSVGTVHDVPEIMKI